MVYSRFKQFYIDTSIKKYWFGSSFNHTSKYAITSCHVLNNNNIINNNKKIGMTGINLLPRVTHWVAAEV